MLSCLKRAFTFLAAHTGQSWDLYTVPQDDPETYAMLSRADSLGVFQVESRAQMNMLPRMRPQRFYDLVIEVAIVRPGPIQGDMVNPYLRRREGLDPVEYAKPELRAVLEKTLGVPLFQEQAMEMAMVAAGFSAARADALRRSIAAFKGDGRLLSFREEFVSGMVGRGYEPDFAERCWRQIEGFSGYGFRRATRRPSRTSSMRRRGSSATTPRSSPPRC
jgi:error-prone DNA polymerase